LVGGLLYWRTKWLRRLLHLRLGAPQGQGELLRDLLRLLPPGVAIIAHFIKPFFHQG